MMFEDYRFNSSESQRLMSLYETGILDTPPEERFDRFTRMAQLIFDVPIALVSLVDWNRQWFKSCAGLDMRETPRSISFCSHSIMGDEIMMVEDASLDPNFKDNPLVTGTPNIRFYAGIPIRGPRDQKIGTFCIIDRKPRRLSDNDKKNLEHIGKIVENEIATTQLTLRLVEQVKEKAGIIPEYESKISFIDKVQHSCVVVVDIVNSTRVTSKLTNAQASKYYNVFLNLISIVAEDTGATVVKNIGDSLLLYYESTLNNPNQSVFREVLESCMAILSERSHINAILSQSHLPEINYRVSCDYGSILFASAKNSNVKDIFGSPVNFCSKINRLAKSNEIVIGGDMYQCVKNLRNFVFKELKKEDNPSNYSVYRVDRN